MSDHAFGAANPRAFDPNTSTHYALSEFAQFELTQLFRAMAAVAQVMDTQPGQIAPEIEPHNIAPIFATFASHGERILGEAPCLFPRVSRRAAA